MLEMGAPVNDVLEAAKDAGRQIIRDGSMSSETLSIVSRELLPMDTYIQIVNQNFHERLEESKEPEK
jgi:hypothetical protein